MLKVAKMDLSGSGSVTVGRTSVPSASCTMPQRPANIFYLPCPLLRCQWIHSLKGLTSSPTCPGEQASWLLTCRTWLVLTLSVLLSTRLRLPTPASLKDAHRGFALFAVVCILPSRSAFFVFVSTGEDLRACAGHLFRAVCSPSQMYCRRLDWQRKMYTRSVGKCCLAVMDDADRSIHVLCCCSGASRNWWHRIPWYITHLMLINSFLTQAPEQDNVISP